MAYPSPIYSSANPAVDQLFGREFAAYQSTQAARERAAQEEIARSQIGAQYRLAQAQLQGTQADRDYNRLFREREFQSREKGDEARNALYRDQLKIQQQAADTDKAWKVPRTDLESERRKQAIIDANAAANNDAQRANALLQINIDAAVAAEKKKLPWGAGNLGGVTAANLDDLTHPARKEINKRAFDTVRTQLLAEKGGALNSLIPDPDNFTFKPVQFDSQGNVMAAPFKAPGGTPVDFDYMGNPVAPVSPGVAAGLGPVTPTVTPDAATANPAALGPTAQAVMAVGQPLVDRTMSSAADMFGIKAPTLSPPIAPQTIQVPVDEAHFLEMSAADAAEAERQLRAIPPEQRGAAAAAIRDNLMKSGRATLRVRIPPMHEILRDTNFN
jgi:hypothetical protein